MTPAPSPDAITPLESWCAGLLAAFLTLPNAGRGAECQIFACPNRGGWMIKAALLRVNAAGLESWNEARVDPRVRVLQDFLHETLVTGRSDLGVATPPVTLADFPRPRGNLGTVALVDTRIMHQASAHGRLHFAEILEDLSARIHTEAALSSRRSP